MNGMPLKKKVALASSDAGLGGWLIYAVESFEGALRHTRDCQPRIRCESGTNLLRGRMVLSSLQ
jgi:hypothetical protein